MGRLKEGLKQFGFVRVALQLRKEAKYIRNRVLACPKHDRKIVKKKYREVFGRDLNLEEPRALTEKMQWIKLHCRDPLMPVVTDKYTCRLFVSELFGAEYLPECYLVTRNSWEVVPEKLPDVPFIVKMTSGSGSNFIVRDKSAVDWGALRKALKRNLRNNYYYQSQEWHYKDTVQQILVEELLQTSAGTIPNDYKLMFFNGRLVFTYCTVDREGANYRKIYDPNWAPLPFKWVAKGHGDGRDGPDIPAPPTFEKMREIGGAIASLFSMVRVDFYDVDGKLYIGEITLMHGGGLNWFEPDEYDFKLGELLDLSDDMKLWGSSDEIS